MFMILKEYMRETGLRTSVMEKDSKNLATEMFTRVITKRVKYQARECTPGIMEKFTMVSGSTDRSTATECGKTGRATVILDSGFKTLHTDMVCTNGKTATGMKVNGNILSDMDKVKIYLQMVITSSVNISMDFPKVMGNTNGPTAIFTTGNLRKPKSMDMEFGKSPLLIQTQTITKENIKMI